MLMNSVSLIRANLLFVHIMHVLHITVIHSRHGIGTMIGKLGIKTLMNGGYQRLIFRRIGNFRAIRELLVLNMKLSRFGCA